MKAKGFGRRIMAVTLAFSMIWSNGSFTANAEGLQTEQTEQTMERLAENGDVSASDVTGGEVVDPVMAGNDSEANLPTTEEEEENVTETAVTVGEVEITEMGYENAKVKVIITNPAEETISAVDVVKKEDKVDAEKTCIESLGVYGYDEPGNYTGYIPTNEGELELRVAVADGESNITYLMQEINFTRRDASERRATITFKTGATLSAQAQITPWYSADEYGPNGYELCLHYKVDNEFFSWTDAGDSSIVAGSASSTSVELEPNTKYLYYAEIKDAKGNAIELTELAGSQEEPFEFTTPEATTYTKDDFADKALYDIIRAQYDARGLTGPLTAARLSAMTSLDITITEIDGVEDIVPITSLADIPEKMPNLKSLTIAGHNIKDITPLVGMDYLESVDLRLNDIKTLPDLSGCKWRYLDLDKNYLTPENIDITKLPGTLEDYESILNISYRAETMETPDTFYIDDNGQYPLFVKYKGVKISAYPYRTYTMTITIGDVTKVYENAMSSNGKIFAVADAKKDFPAITKGADIKASIKFGDEYNDNLLTDEVTIRYEEKPVIFGECSISTEEREAYLIVRLPGTYTKEQVKAVTIEKDGKVAMSVTAESERLDLDSCSGTDAVKKVYGDFYEYCSFYNTLSYQYTVIYGYLTTDKAPEAGEYDIVIEFADGVVEGNKLTYPGKFHITDAPIVSWLDVNPSGYDQTGEYYYIRLGGYNFDEKKVSPVIVDAAGTEYTTVDSVIINEGSYDYKLKKNAKWADIEKSSYEYYYVKFILDEDVEDQTSEEDKMIPAEYLRSTGILLEPLASWYNWKKEAFEFSFNGTVKKNTEISLKLYSDWERKNLVAEGKGTADADGFLSIVPKTTAGETYLPETGNDAIAVLVSGDVTQEISISVDYYNKHDDGSSKNVMRAYTQASYYLVGTNQLSVTAQGSADAHSTKELSAKLYAVGSSDVLATAQMTYEQRNGTDYFSVTDWKLDSPLTARSYVIRVTETVDSVEKELCNTYFSVIASGFYEEYQGADYYWSDKKKASLWAELPLTIVENSTDTSDIQKMLNELGLNVEVYDVDLNKVNASVKPVRTDVGGGIVFEISGLSADAAGYYFRITKNGHTAVRPDGSGEAFYSDAQHGQWSEKDGDFSVVERQYDVEAYTSISVSDFEEDAPYTVSFYNKGDKTNAVVYSFKIEKTKIDVDGFYNFTKKDVAKLAADKVYRCRITSNRDKIRAAFGYFAAYTGTQQSSVAVKSVGITTEGGTAIKVGDSLQLRAVITPDNASNQSVVWTSSNPTVATVDSNGLVRGLTEGTAVITVVTDDGGKEAVFTLHVIDVDDSLYVEFKDGREYEFTGTKITPAVDVVYHGKILMEGVDYTVKYSNNVNASTDKAKVTVTGKTVPASATAGFVIKPVDIDDDAVSVGAIRITKGSKAVPVLYYGNYKLAAKDYDYPDATKKFTEVGFDTITLTGKGNFTGERKIDVEVVSDKKSLKKFKVTFKAEKRTYNGEEQFLNVDEDGEFTELQVFDAANKDYELTEGDEFVIAYPQDTTSAGTVKFSIIGIGNYTGVVTKSYKINPAKKAASEFIVSIIGEDGIPVTDGNAKVSYKATGATPAVNVTYGEDDLVPGKDYKVSYSGNKKVSTDKAKAKCTITFLGNYKGTAKIVREFEIVPAGIDAESADVQVVSMDKVFVKAGKYESVPIVTVNGVALSKKDYAVKYTYTQDGEDEKDVELPKKLEESSLKDGMLNVKVTVTGKGNYDSKTTAVGYYKIVKLPTAESVNVYDLSKAKVVIRNKTSNKKVSSFKYTGSEITIGEENEIYVTVKVKGSKNPVELKEGQDFEVVYTNNVNKGKATIVLTGLGKKGTGKDSTTAREVYGGKTTTFSIGKGILSWL